ncbi:MAG: hypothetical protein CL916_00020 [Deltaproteobacteria bacterium]|nr:hypothetical protein [Deltaproteobacteria bacterium]
MNSRISSGLLVDIFCAVLVCFPILLSPTQKLLGSELVDVWNHSWGGYWWAHSLAQGELPWYTTLLTWPNGGVLWFIDPILALISAPFAFLSLAFGYNIACFVYVAFASWCIRFFARALGAPNSGQYLSAGAFACSGWMISELHNGITEACNIGPAALALGWCTYAKRKMEWLPWIYTGLSLSLCFVTSPYLGLGTSIAVGIYSIPSFRRAWLGGIVGIIGSLPTVLAMRNQLESSAAIIKKPPGMNDLLALHNAVDPRTFIAPFGFQSRDLSHEGFVHTMYLGIPALCLAIFYIRKKPVLLTALFVCILCALGPYLYIGDGWYTVNGAKLRLPWWYLQQSIPALSITHPLRIGIPALAIVAACAGASLRDLRIEQFQSLLIPVVFLDSLLICGAPWPLKTAPAQYPVVYDEIAADTRNVGVLDLPTDSGSTMAASRYLYWQSRHNKPIPYAPDVRASTSSLLRYQSFRYLASLCNRRSDEDKALGLRNQHQVSPKELRSANIGWIVLHKDLDPKATQSLLPYLTKELGKGIEEGSAVRWKIQ